MKKLICAAIVAGSMVAMAEECATAKCCNEVAKSAEAVKAAVETVKESAKALKPTEEQRAAMRAARDKFIAERKAQMEAKLLEITKKYVAEEEKAKALVKEIQDAVMSGRSMMRRPQRPEAAKPVEAK